MIWILLCFLLPFATAQFPAGGGYISVPFVKGPIAAAELTADDKVDLEIKEDYPNGVFYLTHLSHADVTGASPDLDIYATEAYEIDDASGMIRIGVACDAYYGDMKCGNCTMCDAAGRPVSPTEYVPWDLDIFPFSFDCSGIDTEKSCMGIQNPRRNCHEADECCPKDNFPTGVATCFDATPPQPTFAPVVIGAPTTNAPTTVPPTAPVVGRTPPPTSRETASPTMSPTAPGSTRSPMSSTLSTISPVKGVGVPATFAPVPMPTTTSAAVSAQTFVAGSLAASFSFAMFLL